MSNDDQENETEIRWYESIVDRSEGQELADVAEE
jgi:hypothetical protein